MLAECVRQLTTFYRLGCSERAIGWGGDRGSRSFREPWQVRGKGAGFEALIKPDKFV